MKATRIKLSIILLSLLFVNCNKQTAAVYLNQVGYTPFSVKRAFVSNNFEGESFRIVDEASQNVVFNGVLSKSKKWSPSGTSVCIADFTEFQKTGEYKLEVGTTSKKIEISENINKPLGLAALKSYYYARASETITEEFAEDYARALGHADNAVKIHSSAVSNDRPEGTIISSSGGWYDAGDYNKYIVNSGITMHTLLQLYELFPDYCENLQLNIPESTNLIPDILDEILVNLRWMLTMQDSYDGGVYHKLTSKNFSGMVMPNKDKLERYVVSKSTAATLDFAAVTSKSYRIFSKFEKELPGLADSCLVASKLAWQWAQENPNILYVQPNDIATGAYDDNFINDEKYWAANELFLSTNENEYLKEIDFKTLNGTPHWSKVGSLGDFSRIIKSDSINLNTNKIIKQNLLESANQLYKTYDESAFKISIDSFAWGSNSDLANQGVLLIHAFLVSKESKYFEAAEACLNYLLGANPLDKSFVTGFGINTPMHVHDRRCSSDGIENPIPGLLVGGPTKQAREDCGEENYKSKFPALSYVDMECSYSTNEIAINWNAPLAFLVNSIEAINSQKEKQ